MVSLPGAKDLPLAAIGFCMGGQAVLELAREGAPFEAVVSFHGLLNTEMPAEAGKISARILICHGDADALVPREQVLGFWDEMDAAGANWHFHSYSGVEHSFTNPAGAAYDPSADRQCWTAMHALFDEKPLRRYMVVPNDREQWFTIQTQLDEMVQLNQWGPYSYSRDELVEMLDATLSGEAAAE